MPEVDLIVFKGKESQTGLAYSKEFNTDNINDSELGFGKIREEINNKPLKIVLPIWNSHEGEVSISYALSMIFESDIKLYYLWPKEIQFECITKDLQDKNNKNVISVNVAKTQCSKFIDANKLNYCLANDTKDAYTKFKNDSEDKYYAALIAPGQNKDRFNLLCEKSENKLNFTTFTILGSPESNNWSREEWGELYDKIFPSERIFLAIEMSLDRYLSDAQQELFDALIKDVRKVEDIPKALFVSNDNSSEIRILFETDKNFILSEILNEYGSDDSIKIIHDAGESAFNYSERVMDFLNNNDDFPSHDFIKHSGTQTCFYSCSALGIVTHGFQERETELIVRKIINKCFELLAKSDIGDELSPSEKLFKKYEKQYFENGLDCISFVEI